MTVQEESSRPDRITGGVVLLAGVAIIWQACRLRLGNFHTPGPGLFPLLLGSVVVFLSLCLLAFRSRSRKDARSFSAESLLRVGRVYGSLIAYFLVLEHLGFLLSTFLLVSYLSIVIGKQKAVGALVRAVLVTVFSYLLFDVVLKGQLPKGILGL